MRHFVLSLLLMFSGAAFVPAVLAQEPAVAAADAKAIEGVIRAQLDAFAHDDADKAFSYAAPGIRNVFGSAANFISMVKRAASDEAPQVQQERKTYRVKRRKR